MLKPGWRYSPQSKFTGYKMDFQCRWSGACEWSSLCGGILNQGGPQITKAQSSHTSGKVGSKMIPDNQG
jgi:hypothetical protein